MKTTTIAKTDSLFDPLAWVCKAVGKDKTREALMHVKIEHGNEIDVVATDGRRLHAATVPFNDATAEILPAGLFRPRVSAREIILMGVDPYTVSPYPQWRNVIPSYTVTPADGVCRVSGEYRATMEWGGLVSSFIAWLNRRSDYNFVFNDHYLSDALGLGTLFTKAKGSHTWKYVGEHLAPLLMTGEHHAASKLRAVVMPVRG